MEKIIQLILLIFFGKLELKYMTAKEEDILTNQNYISQGTVLDKLIESLIISSFGLEP